MTSAAKAGAALSSRARARRDRAIGGEGSAVHGVGLLWSPGWCLCCSGGTTQSGGKAFHFVVGSRLFEEARVGGLGVGGLEEMRWSVALASFPRDPAGRLPRRLESAGEGTDAAGSTSGWCCDSEDAPRPVAGAGVGAGTGAIVMKRLDRGGGMEKPGLPSGKASSPVTHRHSRWPKAETVSVDILTLVRRRHERSL